MLIGSRRVAELGGFQWEIDELGGFQCKCEHDRILMPLK